MSDWKYLHRVNEICWRLDHRVTPEVSAMFSAMVSRLPRGGIEARYREVVEAVAQRSGPDPTEEDGRFPLFYQGRECWPFGMNFSTCGLKFVDGGQDMTDVPLSDIGIHPQVAEEALAKYPLHPVVQEFFDKFVGQYGHGSIKELSGQPAVFWEGISPFNAYLSFDNPLVSGQESSTRAVRHRNWPMCREARVHTEGFYNDHVALKALHESWLEVFEAEVEAWKVELRLPCQACSGNGVVDCPDCGCAESPDCERCGRDGMIGCATCDTSGLKYSWIKDPQSFRPALDRARWALPSTIATAVSHTGNLRTMSRVVADGLNFSAREALSVTWEMDDECPHCKVGTLEVDNGWASCRGECGNHFAATQRVTEPSKVWQDFAEAYDDALPGMAGMGMKEAVVGKETPLPGHLKIGFRQPADEVQLAVSVDGDWETYEPYVREGRNYIDPMWNQLAKVHIEFQCSWAVARDWHRHRTAFPWHLNIVKGKDGIDIHPSYQPMSMSDHHADLIEKSEELFEKFRKDGDMEKAMLCLPFGTLVSMRTTMGLRDAVYMLELRAYAHGANWEYEEQALEALRLLKEQLPEDVKKYIWTEE